MKCIIGIYKIENLVNHKIYIGQSIDIHRRWQEHLRDSNCAMYQDFKFYGKENFSFEVIEECLREQLNEKEKYWISYYNSYKEGYNRTIGGQSSYQEPKKVYLYDDKGSFLREFNSALEASQYFGISDDGMRLRCQSEKIYDKYIFSYQKFDQIDVKEKAKRFNNAIKQFDLEGNYIRTYKNLSEVLQKNPTFSKSGIYAVLESRKTGSSSGYRWCYENEELLDYKLNYKTVSISQYDLNKHKMAEYNSLIEAEQKTGISHKNISSALTKKAKTAGGFYWFYSNQSPDFNEPIKREKSILQFSLDDEFIKEYESLKEAAKAVGLVDSSSIGAVARGKRKTAGGFKWKYKN